MNLIVLLIICIFKFSKNCYKYLINELDKIGSLTYELT